MNYSLSTSDKNHYNSVIKEDPGNSSGETTDFDTERTECISSISITDTNSIVSSFNDKQPIPNAQVSIFHSNLYFL